jgi:hypothetical protein
MEGELLNSITLYSYFFMGSVLVVIIWPILLDTVIMPIGSPGRLERGVYIPAAGFECQ